MNKKSIKLPSEPGFKFLKRLVIFLGGDPSLIKKDWCWESFAKQYPHLRTKIEKLICDKNTCNPGLWAYRMCKYFGSSRAWAEHIIETSKRGDLDTAAGLMRSWAGSSYEWSMRMYLSRGKNK